MIIESDLAFSPYTKSGFWLKPTLMLILHWLSEIGHETFPRHLCMRSSGGQHGDHVEGKCGKEHKIGMTKVHKDNHSG